MAIFSFGRKDPQPEPAAAPSDETAPKKSLLDRLKSGLAKTAQVLSTDVRDLFKREGRLVDDAFLEELRAALIRTDMGPNAAEAIVVDVKNRLRSRVVEPEVVVDSIRTQLLARLAEKFR